MKIFIIHGAYGSPQENWFPWLKDKLEEKGHTVFVPNFPTPENQSLSSWMKVFEDNFNSIDEDTIFVGHSLGPAFILSILEKLSILKPIRACFFVAGFIGLLCNEEFDKINETFTKKEFDWEKIKKTCNNFYLFNSTNDPYVPLEKGEELAEKLNGELIKMDNAGHFNEDAGYNKFEEILKYIENE